VCLLLYAKRLFPVFGLHTKKELGNSTNIFSSQIKAFPIPDCDETKQAEIVEKIKTQLDAQTVSDRQIEEKQQAINKIIEDE
jgi:type I restriction enzyme S subunit